MRLPENNSILKARGHYKLMVSELAVPLIEKLGRPLEMDEFNGLVFEYGRVHGLTELEVDNIFEIKFDEMISDGVEPNMDSW